MLSVKNSVKKKAFTSIDSSFRRGDNFSKNYFARFKVSFSKKAFTLIELLVVIAIIGILATLAVVALQQARSIEPQIM